MILKTIIIIYTPAMGGPKSEAKPWNNKSWPNALVSWFKPNKSTKITDVRPT